MAGCTAATSNFNLAHNLLDEIRSHKNCKKMGKKKKNGMYGFGLRPCLLTSLLVMDSRRNLASSPRDVRANASEFDVEVDDNFSGVDDDLALELGPALPASLNWLWSLSSSIDDPSPRGCRSMGFGVIFELNGVLVEGDDPELERCAWCLMCKEEGKQFPSDNELRSMEGMLTEEAISEVLGWSEDPLELQSLAARKEEIYCCLRGCDYQLRQGTMVFLSRLLDYGIPMAVVSARPRNGLEQAIKTVGLEEFFTCVVAAEDLDRGKPDPEMFKRAADLLELAPEQCIVIGNSDLSVAAATSAGMSSVVVASNKPVYEFRAASRVVRWLNELSVADLERSTNPIQRRARETHMEMD
ncbi:5-amino-6-(5-phospho-D-ribitylamino)uracil phosphatase, chloroplastic-like [Zingiber officinale]|uniref:Uncharacterized protein n=1 Tax=Zingiber officinale TaxID=94328 RepID=A0A8J5FLI3_ZINOF|nr:5-amino-6-(5-phospho-D-ribitylamino)uracil phosphatase, chloroplastic-like [Zingiber officinale]XP_042411361.1 5-amino-6-(5-phospho-D-ribitylamino)uracil phosphatase, chloroplastic-like [Zingiber officinale]KAG6491878.1 hypothetical protein ZIOFF_046818 [Zingiber officinale]